MGKSLGLAVIVVAGLLLSALTFGQGGPPGGGGGGYGYKIEIDDTGNGGRIRGLAYEPDAEPVTSSIEDHEVTFRLKVVPLNGAPQPETFNWSPGPSVPPEQISEDSLYFPSSNGSATCTGYAWMPGRKVATCTITVSGNPNPLTLTSDFLVIGGPLRGSASGSYLKTGVLPNEKFLIDTAVPRNASDKSWHAQIFANQGEPVVKEQIPQTILIYWEATAEEAALQFDWTLPSYVADPNHPEASQEGWVSVGNLDLKGTAPGGPGTISCRMKATWTDMHGNSHEGEADDTTALVHGTKPHYSNKIRVHKPTTIIVGASTPGNYTGGLEGYHAAKQHYVMLVKDQNGTGIPGVVVQERFTGSLPPNFRVNEEQYWKTALGGTKSFKLWASAWPDHAQFKSLTVGDGSFHAFDNLAYVWSGSEPSWEAVHQYWAGTSDSMTGARGVGLSQLNWTMTFTAEGTLGNRGTVFHQGG